MGFVFKLPGPDHHDRRMSKCIYLLKVKLLGKVYNISAKEQAQVESLRELILLLYTVHWFATPLASSAVRQDLDFMSSILEYRKVNPRMAYAVLSSTYRHLYLYLYLA